MSWHSQHLMSKRQHFQIRSLIVSMFLMFMYLIEATSGCKFKTTHLEVSVIHSEKNAPPRTSPEFHTHFYADNAFNVVKVKNYRSWKNRRLFHFFRESWQQLLRGQFSVHVLAYPCRAVVPKCCLYWKFWSYVKLLTFASLCPGAVRRVVVVARERRPMVPLSGGQRLPPDATWYESVSLQQRTCFERDKRAESSHDINETVCAQLDPLKNYWNPLGG